MLQKLFIQNYVLIDSLELDLNKGLTIITGETGAGKSILLGALSMILGERADKNVLLDKTRKCVVEGVFSTRNKDVKGFFKDHGLDFEEQLILRREINGEGKSRSFINDTPVSLSQLKELSVMIVDIHSQHETLFLRQKKFQLSVVDAFAGTENDLSEYSQSYNEYKSLRKRLAELEEVEKKSKADQDYYQFLFDELNEVSPKAGEQEKAEEELTTMTHAEEIKNNLSAVSLELSGNENNLINRISKIQLMVQGSVIHFQALEDINQRLKSASIELKDISNEIELISDGVVYDSARIEEIQNRLNEIYRLQQKHRAKTIDELLVLKNEFENKLNGIASIDQEIEDCRQQLKREKDLLVTLAKKISAKRNKSIPGAEKEITKLLTAVNLPNAVLKIENTVSAEDDFSSDGIDSVRFMFSANKGIVLREIEKAASGGELSRLMLCIKAAVAKLVSLPVMIFDEIDTGISGETALNVASVLKQLSGNHQLIAITHLPQIAGRGDHHYYVFKEVIGKRTAASVKQLSRDERIVEIAKMLSGDKPSAVAVENAKELLRN
ncbi:MAG: DNA repair protein RecN [Bacteroidetes bacterium]|nr:DNA repair protein RecN [Bacteroidota bacterium]